MDDGFESCGGGTASYPGAAPVFGRGRAPPRLLQTLVFLAASLSVLSAVPMALAAFVVHSGTDFDVCVRPTGGFGTTPLVAIQITVTGKEGALPSSFDSTKSGFSGPGPFPGITTVGNRLHQVWEFFGLVMTPTLDLAGDPTPFPREIDSHFLIDASPGGNVHPYNPPFEDRVPNPAEDFRGGFGSFLQGTFFLRAGYETPTWDLAQVVVPAGTELRFDFEVNGSLGQLEEVDCSYRVLTGDMDFDGTVDFDDVGPFVLGLADPEGYSALFGLEPTIYGDVDRDGDVDFDDIPPFVAALASAGAADAVPEPAPGALVLFGLMILAARRARAGAVAPAR